MKGASDNLGDDDVSFRPSGLTRREKVVKSDLKASKSSVNASEVFMFGGMPVRGCFSFLRSHVSKKRAEQLLTTVQDIFALQECFSGGATFLKCSLTQPKNCSTVNHDGFWTEEINFPDLDYKASPNEEKIRAQGRMSENWLQSQTSLLDSEQLRCNGYLP